VKPRVIVSSVILGLEEAREGARRGIEEGGGDPLLVNEDFPAMSSSPRNACLDAVDSSDVYLVILGARAGYLAPSGRPVVEEEYERAIARGLPILAFVQENVDREPEADRLEKRVSGYVGGHFRSSFTDSDDLRKQVAKAIRSEAGKLRSPIMDPGTLNQILQNRSRDQRDPVLRTVIAPVRNEEVIDTVEMGRTSFRETMVNLGMAKEVGLFSAWHAKDSELREDTLSIQQDGGNSPPVRYARLELSPNGLLILESNVSDRQPSARGSGMLGLQILESDIIEVLGQHFAFANRLYDHVDPYQRQHAVLYNCALLGAGYRTLAKTPASGGSMRMSMRGDEPIVVHPQPRQVGRAVLANPEPEIDRALELLRRRMTD
jgi:uncharacterized protein DUF4062